MPNKFNVVTMLRTCGKYIYSGLDSGSSSYIEKSCQVLGVNVVFNRLIQKDVNKPNLQRSLENEKKKVSSKF